MSEGISVVSYVYEFGIFLFLDQITWLGNYEKVKE